VCFPQEILLIWSCSFLRSSVNQADIPTDLGIPFKLSARKVKSGKTETWQGHGGTNYLVALYSTCVACSMIPLISSLSLSIIDLKKGIFPTTFFYK